MLFKFTKTKTIVFLVVLTVVVIALGFSFIKLNKSDRFSVEPPAAKLLEKSAALVKKARHFDQEKALKSLGNTSLNDFYFRFDDHIKKARVEGTSAAKPEEFYLLNAEFDETDTIHFQSKKEKLSISGGTLKVKHAKGGYLDAIVNIPISKVGELEIRVKQKSGNTMQFGLFPDIDETIPEKSLLKNIQIIPDDKFHVYKINVKHIWDKTINEKKSKIKRIYFCVSNVWGDDVEIDYIKLLSKMGHYLKKATGASYEVKNNEMRKVLYTQTPLSVTYDLEIPKKEVYLSFGLGIIADDPVTFTISTDGTREIFSKKVISSDRWHDVKMDMGDYSGKKVQITFAADSPTGNIALWSNPILFSPPKEKCNIIIVLEDALRADHTSFCGYHRETTPVKKKFAQKGVLFLNSFAQAPNTQASCLSIMTGLYPTATRTSLHENYLTLAEILRHKGFQTAAFIQNANAGPFVGLHQGYSYLFDTPSDNFRSSDIYTKKPLDWIKNHHESNYFLYLHVADPHAPYNPPEQFRHWYTQLNYDKTKHPKKPHLDPDWVKAPTLGGRKARYDGEIKNNDFYFKHFLTGLNELNSLDHTLIIFLADHGEYLGEHKRWSHKAPNFIQVIKTPLIMVYPNKLPSNRIVNQPVQNLDIVPTILDLLNINKDNLLLAGDSLLPLIFQKKPEYFENRLIVSDENMNLAMRKELRAFASIIYKDTHIINSKNHPMRAFNYKQDTQEKKGDFVPDNLKRFYIKFITDLHESNTEIWQAITRRTTTRTKYDADTIEKLKSLGYIR